MALETFTLKQHLDATRQELSQALYQHDAACRVIARLLRERDEARSMLANFQANGVSSHQQHVGDAGAMEVAVDGTDSLSAEIIQRMNDKNAELSSTRLTTIKYSLLLTFLFNQSSL